MKQPASTTRPVRVLTTSTLSRIRGGAIPDVTLKRGQFEEAPHDQSLKVYVDVVY